MTLGTLVVSVSALRSVFNTLSGSACVVLKFGQRFRQQGHVREVFFSMGSLAYARLVWGCRHERILFDY